MKGIFVLCILVGFASSSSMFFNTPIRLLPNISMKSDFGFSMGYQNSTTPRLVVGAPRRDSLGAVFTCPLTDVSKEIICSEVPKELPKTVYSKNIKYRDKLSPKQYYFLGSTIAAIAENFLTCAPMAIKNIGGSIDAYGTCFWYSNINNKFSQIQDNGIKVSKKYSEKMFSKDIMGGGLGWNSLLDEEHGRILISKTAEPGDITYIDINAPLAISKSLYERTDKGTKMDDFWNLGYGLAVGNFFDNETHLYAVSYRKSNLKGSILFLNEIEDRHLTIKRSSDYMYNISNEELGSMFGYALATADFNGDGLSELVVGAPAQTDDTKKWEPGAIHIYVGGQLSSVNDQSRMRTILGTHNGGRFGSAIAISDTDGDNIPELFVSAPYQYSEEGVVYVISGYELRRTLIEGKRFKRILLSELKFTQELRSAGSRHLGISLQVVPDFDENGCNAMAVGSPTSDLVLLYRCLPSVTAKIQLKQLGDEIVKENANDVTITVCVSVTMNEKALKKSIEGRIKVTHSMDKPSTKLKPDFFYFDLPLTYFCQNITVKFLKSEKGYYTLNTQLDMFHGSKNNDYKQLAVLSPYSDLHKSTTISRFCNTEEDCKPDFKLKSQWLSGDEKYDFGSKTVETMKISVRNEGHEAMGELELFISGARLSTTTNQCVRSGNDGFPLVNHHYLCSLPKLITREMPVDISISLNKTEPINAHSLIVIAQIHSRIGSVARLNITKPVKLDSTPVQVDGTCHNFNVTDKDLANSGLSKYTDNHEYYIHNNGPITWVNLTAELIIQRQPFIQHVELITIETCTEVMKDDKTEYYTFRCALNLKPYSTASIVPSIEISKDKIGKALVSGKLNTNSKLSLLLQPTNDVRNLSLSTTISYQKILTVGNNITMILIIGIIVALVIIIALAFILYKCGFFQRAEKKQLESLRESVRRRNERQGSESRKSRIPTANEYHEGSSKVICKSAADEFHNDIEMFDENEDFNPSPHSSKDDTKLIKGKIKEEKK